MDGGAGNDTLLGGDGIDTLDGGAGTDQVTYGNDTAAVTVNLATGVGGKTATGGDPDTNSNGINDNEEDILSNFETVTGSAYNDNITGSTGDNVLHGGAGVDTIYGGAGDDTIYGEAGDDTMDGEAGDDTLLGGDGIDTMDGGADDDTFVFGAGDDDDTINDFTAGASTDDVLDYSSQSSLTYSDLSIAQVGGDTVITNTVTGDTVTLIGITSSNLDQTDDFLFA
jgi:Ca2+-binding RTX toxin-like protein